MRRIENRNTSDMVIHYNFTPRKGATGEPLPSQRLGNEQKMAVVTLGAGIMEIGFLKSTSVSCSMPWPLESWCDSTDMSVM